MKKPFLFAFAALFILASYFAANAQKPILSNPELIPYRKGAKWGYCNEKKDIVIACKYDSVAEYFFQGLAYIMLDKKFGYIDTAGKVVIPIKFGSATSFNSDLRAIAGVTEKGKSFFIDLQGRVCDVPIVGLCGNSFLNRNFKQQEGWVIRVGNKFAFASNQGSRKMDSIAQKWVTIVDTLVKPVYENMVDTYLGLLLAKRDGKWGGIDIHGNEVIPFVWDSLAPVTVNAENSDFEGILTQKNGLYGLMDSKGRELVRDKYIAITVSNRYIGYNRFTPATAVRILVLTQGGRWGYISQTGIEYFED